MIHGVRLRLAAITVGAAFMTVVIVLLAGAAVLRARLTTYVEDAALADLERRAESFARALDSVQAETRSLAVALGKPSLELEPEAPSENVLTLASRPDTDIRRFAEIHYLRLRRITVVDRAGAALAAVQPTISSGARITALPLDGQDLEQAGLSPTEWADLCGQGRWISPAREIGGVQFIRCAARVEAEGGTIGGIVVDARTDALLSGGDEPARFGGFVFVLDAHDLLLSHPDEGALGRPLALVDPELHAAVKNIARAGLAWIERGGRRNLLRMGVVSGGFGEWRLARLADVEDLLGGLNRVVGFGLLVAAGAGLACAAVSWRMSLGMVKSIEALARTAKRVGAGDLEARVGVDRTDELGDLARAFNAMAEELRRALSAVEERARLEERDRARAELLANVSHDLRTPVTAVRWSVDNMLDGVVGRIEPRQAEYLEGMRESADHLLLLIDDLIHLSRLEAGRLELQREELDLGRVAREAARMLEPVALRKRVRIDVSGEAAVRGDRDRLRQVFANLLDNAVAFSPEGGVVRVEVDQRQPGRRAIAIVSDQGPGVSPEIRPRLFERFQSGRSSGVGIGLHLARSLVRLHGGELSLDDGAENGARLRIELPGSDGP